MSEAKEAMKQLQAKWYNSVCAGLSLDRDTFQLIQGSKPIGSTSGSVEQMFDAIPPKQTSRTYNPSRINSFYQQYSDVISVLKKQNIGGDQLRRVLGDDYQAWKEYAQNHPSQMQSVGPVQFFHNWAVINIPGKAQQATNVFKKTIGKGVKGPISKAQNKLSNYSLDGGEPDYTHGGSSTSTIDALTGALKHGKPASISFDSSKASSKTSDTWAEGGVGGFYDFFVGEGGGDWEKLNQKASSNQVTVDAEFKHTCSFSANPSKEWFDSGALSIAYHNNNQTVWKAESNPDWEDAFGDDGSLKRLVTSVIAYDGIDVKVTSHASYSSEEKEHVDGETDVGVFPFFDLEAASGHSKHVSRESDGAMTVQYSLPIGNPNFLGVNVNPIESVVGNS